LETIVKRVAVDSAVHRENLEMTSLPATASFSATATTAAGLKKVVWFFGDLGFARGATATHTYYAGGPL